MVRLGLISDTHGRLDPRIAEAFVGVDRILHAGDLCSPQVLSELELLGRPVQVVRGNCDVFDSPSLPDVARFEISGVRFVLVHDRWYAGPITSAEADVVVFGHSHVPAITEVDGVLWVNPGSATQPRRSAIGRSVGILEIAEKGDVRATIVPLSDFGSGGEPG